MKEAFYDYDPAAALNAPEALAIFMADAFVTLSSSRLIRGFVRR